MKLDFWNNPLVVTAFRVRHRRGSPFNALVLYPMVLLIIGVAIPYFEPAIRKPWLQTYAFYSLMGLQFVVCGLWAGGATAASMRAEVLNQTLDFRRISCLSPRQILLGKLLGEPAMAFFMAISTFPLAVICWSIGDISIEVLGLMYLNLMTHILMCGAAGLVVSLELKEDKTLEGNFVGLVAFTISLPLPLLYESQWFLQVLMLYPCIHLLLAILAFHSMERQLDNALYPMLGKRMSYFLLLLVDVVTALLLAESPLSFGQRCASFCLAHLIASLVLTMGVTPWRETLRTWVWRFRGRVPWWHDSLVGDRADNTMVLVVYALMGLVNLGLLVVPLALSRDLGAEVTRQWPTAAAAAGISTLLILALGVSFQWFLFIFGKGGNGLFIFAILMLIHLPLVFGPYPELHIFLPLSPSAQFFQWFVKPDHPYSVVPVVAIYGALLVLSWWSMRRRLQWLEQVVERRLEKMGVTRSI